MVSAPAPGTFVHVAHVGFNAQGDIETSDDVEPGWTMMLRGIQGRGVAAIGHVPVIETGKPQGTEKKRSLAPRKPVVTFA